MIAITQNHLDAVRDICGGMQNKEVALCVQNADANVLQVYQAMNTWDLYRVRQALLGYLLGKNVRGIYILCRCITSRL